MSQPNNIIAETASATTFARELKVRTLQNKVTVFIVALAMFLGWGFLLSTRQGYLSARDAYAATQADNLKKMAEQKQVLSDIKVLNDVSSDGQRQALIQCYNTNCSNLPAPLQQEPAKSAFKTFLQLQQATTDTKFSLDQKKLLAYINEFLVKTPDGSQTNGDITSLNLGVASKTATPDVISIPVTVTINFPNKQSLLGFLRNTEQLVSPTFPMLSTVNSVTYDIVKSDEQQQVNVSLTIYMLQP